MFILWTRMFTFLHSYRILRVLVNARLLDRLFMRMHIGDKARASRAFDGESVCLNVHTMDQNVMRIGDKARACKMAND